MINDQLKILTTFGISSLLGMCVYMTVLHNILSNVNNKFMSIILVFFVFLLFCYIGIKNIIKIKNTLLNKKYENFSDKIIVEGLDSQKNDEKIINNVFETIENQFFKATNYMFQNKVSKYTVYSFDFLNFIDQNFEDKKNIPYKGKVYKGAKNLLEIQIQDLITMLTNKYPNYKFGFNTFLDLTVELNKNDNVKTDTSSDVETQNEILKCEICKTFKKNTVCNCGHVFCKSCTKHFDNCPLCSKSIVNKHKIFL